MNHGSPLRKGNAIPDSLTICGNGLDEDNACVYRVNRFWHVAPGNAEHQVALRNYTVPENRAMKTNQ